MSHLIGRGRYRGEAYPSQPVGFTPLGVAASFVLRPGGAAGPGVFTDPEALRGALLTVDPGLFKVVTVDPSLANAHLTPGRWAVNLTTFQLQLAATGDFSLHIDTGAVLDTTWLRFASDLIVSEEAVGTSPIVTSANTQVILDEDAELATVAGAAPLLHVTTVGNFSKLFLNGESQVGDASHHVATVDAGQTLVAIITNGANLTDHAVTGGGTLSSHLSPGALLGTQDTAFGFQSVLGDSHLVRYTPGDVTKWVGPAPTTVQQALDRIAANTANAHPIP